MKTVHRIALLGTFIAATFAAGCSSRDSHYDYDRRVYVDRPVRGEYYRRDYSPGRTYVRGSRLYRYDHSYRPQAHPYRRSYPSRRIHR